MAIISIFLATLLASSSYANNAVNPVNVVSGTPAIDNVPITNTPADTSGVAQQANIGGIQRTPGQGPDIGPSNPNVGGFGNGGLGGTQNQRLIAQQLLAQQVAAQQQQQQQTQVTPVTVQTGQTVATPVQVVRTGDVSGNVINTQQQISNNINNNVIGLNNNQNPANNRVTGSGVGVNNNGVNTQQPQTPNNRHIGLGQTPNNIGLPANGLGNVRPVNQGFGGVPVGNQGFISPAAQLIVGTYQWIGQDSSIYTLFICTGLQGDRMVYASVHRTNINAYGLPDNSYTWAYIVSRGIVTLGADGASASLRGFRLSDAYGINDNFQLLLTYSRCDNLYQLQINDETYTVVKISNAQPQQQQCMRPSYVHTFDNFRGQGNGVNHATFQSFSPLRWRMPNRFGLGNAGINNFLTLRGGMFNNQFGVFGCGGFQNPLNNQFFPGYRRHFGNFGPFGNMFWNNALMVNAFDDDMFEMDFDWDCDRGIEFGLFLDDGDFWENQQCWNTPNIGWAGRMLPIAPMPGFGLNQCPMPNLAGLNPRFFPGWTPFPMQGFFGW